MLIDRGGWRDDWIGELGLGGFLDRWWGVWGLIIIFYLF